ncbi:MAG: cupin domain-containing protein [Gemmatimonadales bacterium]
MRHLSDTLADTTLPADALAEMERLNDEAAPLHIWLRTRANQPLQRPWHEAADDPLPEPPSPDEHPPRSGAPRVLPHVWKWTEIEPYLHRIAEIAPLAFTERQQFLLTNPGLRGALRVTNTIRVAVSIYKPGDMAPTHLHTPSASRTILSETGGYTLIEGERCIAGRGDLILTPAGTWHGHGNDDREPVIWMDVLDWPLLEYLDVIWMRHDAPHGEVEASWTETDYSQKLYGAGGIVPRFLPETRGSGQGGTPMFHFKGAEVSQTLENLRDQTGSPWDGILVELVNPLNGRPVFPTLTYKAQLLRPSEVTLPVRHTASTVYTVIAGRGYTEVNGKRLDWNHNDIFVIPANMWRRHVNLDAQADAMLYSLTDEPLLQAIGQYRVQGRTQAGETIDLTASPR